MAHQVIDTIDGKKLLMFFPFTAHHCVNIVI